MLDKKKILISFTTFSLSAFITLEDVRAYSMQQLSQVITAEEAQITLIREREIEQLKIVLGRRFAETRKPEILLRLAELYTEKYRFYFLKENEFYQRLLKAGAKPNKVEHKLSLDALHSSIKSGLAVLNSRVSFSKMDQVYYFLGYNYDELGEKKESIKYFQKVVNQYPNSPYAVEAYRNLGEYFFQKNDYKNALKMYERAATNSTLPSYPRTLYKLAWANFKNKDRTKALSIMKKVIELSSGNDKFVGLREEALNDIALFYSEAGKAKEAHDFFKSISGGGELFVRALQRLSSLYERRGDYGLALFVNTQLIEEYGNQEPVLIFEVLAKNIDIQKKKNDLNVEEKAYENLVTFYLSHSSAILKNEKGIELFQRTKKSLKDRTADVHKEAQKKKSVELYLKAYQFYTLYIKGYMYRDSDLKELSQMRFYQADTLLAAGRKDDAIPLLEKLFLDEGELKFRKESASTLFNLFIQKIELAKNQKQNAEDLENRFISLSQKFEEIFPKDPLAAELRYKRARIYANRSGKDGLPSEARKILKELVEKYPERSESVDAARDLVVDLVKRNEKDEASELARSYLNNKILLKTDSKNSLATYLKTVLSYENFDFAKNIENEGDFEKAAQEYEKTAAKAVDQEVVLKALNNASINYEKAFLTTSALRIQSEISKRFPNKIGVIKEDVKRIAAQLIWASRFEEATQAYIKLVQYDFFNNEEKISFLKTSFSIAAGLKDFSSIQNISSKIKTLCSSQSEICSKLFIDISTEYLEAGLIEEGIQTLHSLLSSKFNRSSAQAHYLLYAAYEKQGNTKKAQVHLQEAANEKKSQNLLEKNFSARAAFQLVEPSYIQFLRTKLELPEQKLKSTTRQKLQMLEGLINRYTQVLNYGDGEWGLAALERLSDLLTRFSDELVAAPRPSGMNPEQQKQYQASIDQIVGPLRAKAMEYIKQGYKKGVQLHITSPIFIALTQRYSRKNPYELIPVHFSTQHEGAFVLNPVGVLSNESNLEQLKSIKHKDRITTYLEIRKAPKNSEAWITLGNLEFKQKRIKLAKLFYEQALALNPKSAKPIHNLAIADFLLKNWIESGSNMRKSEQLAGFDSQMAINLTKLMLIYHHTDEASRVFSRVRVTDESEKDLILILSVLSVAKKDKTRAQQLFKELGAQSSSEFNLWYNWAVWTFLGDRSEDSMDLKKDALNLLEDRRDSLLGLEKSHTELMINILREVLK